LNFIIRNLFENKDTLTIHNHIIVLYRTNVSSEIQTNVVLGEKLTQTELSESFVGQITDINIWNRPLKFSELLLYADGCDEVSLKT